MTEASTLHPPSPRPGEGFESLSVRPALAIEGQVAGLADVYNIRDARAPEPPTVKIHGKVRVGGAKEFVPWTAEFPEEQLAYDGLVLQLPGWGGIKRSSRGERHANAVNGRIGISYDPARITGSVRQNLTNSQELHTRTAEAVMFAVSDAITGKQNGIPNAGAIDPDRFMLSTHSMGGFPGTELALRHPGLVDSVIYKGSVGFGGPNIDLLGFIKEMREYVRESGQIEPSVKHLYKILRYYMRSPSRTAGEALACMNGNIVDKVAKLGELGIKTAYLGFEFDSLIPPHSIQATASEVVDTFAIMPGVGHLAPQSHPYETAYTVADIHSQLNTWM